MSRRKQQGAILTWAMVGLFVLTLLALASSRTSLLSTRIASNDVLLGMTYQGAESALAQHTARFNLVEATTSGSTNADGNMEYTFPAVTTHNISTQATVELLSSGDCPALDEIAMSTEIAGESGGVSCQLFRVSGSSRVIGTNAVDQHQAGVLLFVPNKTAKEF